MKTRAFTFWKSTVNNFQLLALSLSRFSIYIWIVKKKNWQKDRKFFFKYHKIHGNTMRAYYIDECIDLHVSLAYFLRWRERDRLTKREQGEKIVDSNQQRRQQQCREQNENWMFFAGYFLYIIFVGRADWSQSNKLFTLQRTLPSLLALLLMMGTIELVSVAIAIRSVFLVVVLVVILPKALINFLSVSIGWFRMFASSFSSHLYAKFYEMPKFKNRCCSIYSLFYLRLVGFLLENSCRGFYRCRRRHPAAFNKPYFWTKSLTTKLWIVHRVRWINSKTSHSQSDWWQWRGERCFDNLHFRWGWIWFSVLLCTKWEKREDLCDGIVHAMGE